jgi:acid phosphatase (class A)
MLGISSAVVGLVSLVLLAGPTHADVADFPIQQQVRLEHYVAPPPDAFFARAEAAEMLVIQDARTPEQAARALADSEYSVFRFADVMGPSFTVDVLPKTAAFFQRVHQVSAHLLEPLKRKWMRLRPFEQDERIKPVIHPSRSPSYPSGHATFGYLAGVLPADMVPERRDAILSRAREYGENRVIGGVHFPSDVAAGREVAIVLAIELRSSAEFRDSFEEVRTEIRRALAF